jgi:hypothetical protein
MRHSIVHLVEHLILALFVGILSWWLTKNSWLGLLGGFINFFMDLDHLLEYLWWKKGGFSFREFLTGEHFDNKGKILVIFHGWEYVFISLIIFFVSGGRFWLVLALSLGSHLTFDQLSWPNHPLAYFLIYRLKKEFRLEKICLDKRST